MICTEEKIKHSLTYGTKEIEFELEYADRKTIEISVHPDLLVSVKAPEDKSLEEVLEKVKKRAAWIIKQKTFFSSYKPIVMERKYMSGETHRYLGKQYRLKIIKSPDEHIKLKNGYINVYTIDRAKTEVVKALLETWYFNHAKLKFQERFNYCYKKVKKYGISLLPTLQIRKMNKRWGSCTNDGRIILNLDLIKAPSHCIDYVIMHELCHLKQRNHNAEFFHLLFQIMPDWEKRKDHLEKIVFS